MIVECFGKTPQSQLIDILMSHPYSEYSLEDLNEFWYKQFKSSENLTEFLNKLYKWNIITKGSKKWHYIVNRESDEWKSLNYFQNLLAGLIIE